MMELSNWLEEKRKDRENYRFCPPLEVFRMREDLYSIYSRCPHDMGDVWIHVLIGTQKALVVDTGFGIGDLKSIVTDLAGERELIVVNTHNHGDHILGNSQFGKVFCHRLDKPMLEKKMYPAYWAEFCKVSDHSFFREEDVLPFGKYEIIPCEDHHTFDLGDGQLIELIWVGGHASGSSVFLDRKHKILFSGDAVMYPGITTSMASRLKSYQNHVEAATLACFTKQLEKLWSRREEFQTLFPGHGVLNIKKDIIEDLLTACIQVMETPGCYDRLEQRSGVECKIKTWGKAQLAYRDERIGL